MAYCIPNLAQAFDKKGNLLSSVETYDYNDDGIADITFSSTQSFDKNGKLVGSVYAEDRDGNGVWDSVATTTFTTKKM